MTVLYKHIELQQTVSNSLKIWKGCHITTYILAMVVGVVNCYFIYTLNLVFEDHCVLYPHELVFKSVTRNISVEVNEPVNITTSFPSDANLQPTTGQYDNTEVSILTNGSFSFDKNANDSTEDLNEADKIRLLDFDASNFQLYDRCNLAFYLPLCSVIFGIIWCTMFMMCPAGGLSRIGLPKPWRILIPAGVFALAFAISAAYGFNDTNNGLDQLCANFSTVTTTNSCTTQMDQHVVSSYNTTFRPSALIVLTRVSSVAVFLVWLFGALLIGIRCIAAPDFHVAQIFVKLVEDVEAGTSTAENTITPDTTRTPVPLTPIPESPMHPDEVSEVHSTPPSGSEAFLTPDERTFDGHPLNGIAPNEQS